MEFTFGSSDVSVHTVTSCLGSFSMGSSEPLEPKFQLLQNTSASPFEFSLSGTFKGNFTNTMACCRHVAKRSINVHLKLNSPTKDISTSV